MTSALERLKQLAKEKQNVQSSVPDSSSNTSSIDSPIQSDNGNGGVNDTVSANTGPVLVPESDNSDSGNHSSVEPANILPAESTGQQGTSDGSNSEVSGSSDSGSVDNGGSNSGLASDHPIKMKLAELEQALIQKIPEFRTILRDIHAKLRQDPDIVTAMSPEEVSVVVQGLMTHAQVDVLAAKAVKSAKKAAKTPLSASDL